MAYTLVGSVGVVSQGAVGAAVTPVFGAGSSQTLGNILICWAAVQGNAQTAPATPSGWTIASTRPSNNAQFICFFWKIAAGSDAAPTITPTAGQVATAQLAEFNAGVVVQAGAVVNNRAAQASANTGSSITATAGNLDNNPTELVVYLGACLYTLGPSVTLTHAANNGVTVTATDNNAAVAVNEHYSFGYGFTTSNAANDNDVLTYTSTGLTTAGLSLQSFKLFDLTPPVLRRTAHLAM
jgi:hypothetical protein